MPPARTPADLDIANEALRDAYAAYLQHGTHPSPCAATKTCDPARGCGSTYPLTHFLHTATRDHGYRLCLTCLTAPATVDITADDGDGTRALDRRRAADRARQYRHRHHLTDDDYRTRARAQHHRCALCGHAPAATRTGRARLSPARPGDPSSPLVCPPCRTTLTLLAGNPDIATATAAYLTAAPSPAPHELTPPWGANPVSPALAAWARRLHRHHHTPADWYTRYRLQAGRCALCSRHATDLPTATRTPNIPELDALNIPRTLSYDDPTGALLCHDCLTVLGRTHRSAHLLARAAQLLTFVNP